MLEGAVYLYGIASAPAAFSPPDVPGVAGARVELLEEGSLTAIVGTLPEPEFHARREDLIAHSDVLQAVVAMADVLPMSFGTVFDSARELSDAFLRPNQDELVRMLERTRGCVEMKVRAEYDHDGIAREIATTDRSLRKLQERVRARGDLESRIELGRRFAAVLDERRYADGRTIVDSIARLASDVSVGDPPGEYGVVSVSFLVGREQLARFDALVADVAAAFAERATLRCVGPLPPYSFVDAGALVVA